MISYKEDNKFPERFASSTRVMPSNISIVLPGLDLVVVTLRWTCGVRVSIIVYNIQVLRMKRFKMQ